MLQRTLLRISYTILITLLLCAALSACKQGPANVVPGSGDGKGDSSGEGVGGGKKSKAGRNVEVTVYAASSTQNVLEELAKKFKANYQVQFNLNYASSGQLAKQIIQGAPADIYLSANDKWMDVVVTEGLTLEQADMFSNSLVIVVPQGNPAKVNAALDLNNDNLDKIAIAEPSSVPAGIYTKQALEHLKLWDQVSPKIVSGANVRVTLAFVEQGEIDAGIVYATDALIAKDKVETVYEFDSTAHQPIAYPLALLKHSSENGIARKFYKFLQSAESQALFKKNGFLIKE